MKIDIPDQKKLVFETHIAVRWGDMDAMGRPNIVGEPLDESPNS